MPVLFRYVTPCPLDDHENQISYGFLFVLVQKKNDPKSNGVRRQSLPLVVGDPYPSSEQQHPVPVLKAAPSAVVLF